MRRHILLTSALAVAAAALVTGCDRVPEPTGGASPAITKAPEAPEPSDLVKEDISVGTGPEAKDGDKVWVHYTGRLAKNNKQFDSSVGKKPLDVELGKGDVIKGWDLGLVGMKVGGKRKLTIPSKLGYGDAGHPPDIPPKATLVFDVELLSIGSPPGENKDSPAASGSAKAGPATSGSAKAGAPKDKPKDKK
ncbi:MAG: FKBP-type peptidyl-prolyl cis-trans isomerase [Polyangiaceae bacterium]